MSELLANWKLILIAILIAGVCIFAELWDSARSDLIEYKASIAQMATDVEAENAKAARVHLQNLEILRKDYEINVPEIRRGAVTAYLARLHAVAGTSGVSGTGPGIKLDDGAVSQCVPDEQFIQDAAEDATKIAAWQQYGKLNHIPVKD